MISVGRRDGMMGLGAGGVEDVELEEGEARFYSDTRYDDDSFDPDVDLGYIEEKLQAILGHHRKSFEGEVSAENLGSVYGGYGSFLPSYQRSPSVLSRPKTPQKGQNYCTPKSLNSLPPLQTPQKVQNYCSPRSQSNLPPGGVHQNTTGASIKRLGIASTNVAALPLPRASSVDTTSKGDVCQSSSRGTRELSPKHGFANKPVNLSNQKTSKVRLKAGPNSTLSQRNAEIYSGLGLDESPSSSVEGSPTQSKGLSPESRGVLYLSPAKILEDTISFPVLRGGLLSPLPKNLLCLTERGTLPSDGGYESLRDGSSLKNSPTFVLEPDRRIAKVSGESKVKSVEKSSKEVNNGSAWNAGHGTGALPKKGKDTENRKEKAWESMTRHGAVKAEAWHSKNNSADKVRNMGAKGDHFFPEFSAEFNGTGDKDRKVLNVGSIDPLKQKGSQKATVQEQNSLIKPPKKEQSLSGDKQKLKESQVNAAPEPKDSKHVKKETSMVTMKPKVIPSGGNNNNSLPSKEYQKETPVVAPLTRNEDTSGAVPALPNPVVIKENWVCCDRCGAWRLLPFGTNSDDLPKGQWFCNMLSWIPGMNRCEISDEETTKALYAMYGLPVPESQNSVHTAPATELKLADERHLDQSHKNRCLPAMPGGGKKKHKLKEASNADSIMGSAHILNSARKQLDASGDIDHSKANGKRWPEQDGFRSSKKFKSERLNHTHEDWSANDGQVIGKVGSGLSNNLPANGLAEGTLKYSEKDLKSHGKDRVPGLIKKPKDQVSFDSGAMYSGRCDKKDLSTKKRKLKEWQESKIYPPETHPINGHRLQDSKASVNDIGENKFIKENKPKVSKCYQKESSTSKGEGKGATQISVSATSSSSKVSGSRRSKSRFPDVKGSPVESVSSSPFRNSNADKVMSARRNLMDRDDTTDVRRCLDSEGDGGSEQFVSARKRKAAPVIQHRSLASSLVDNQQKDANHTSGGKAKVQIERSSGSENTQSANGCADIFDQHNQHFGEAQGGEDGQGLGVHRNHCSYKGSLQGNLGNGSSRSKNKHRYSKFNHDQANAKIPSSFREHEECPSAKNLNYVPEIGCHKESMDEKCNFKGKFDVKSDMKENIFSGREASPRKWSSEDRHDNQLKSERPEGSDVKWGASCSKDRKTNLPPNPQQEAPTRYPPAISKVQNLTPVGDASKVPKQPKKSDNQNGFHHDSSTRHSAPNKLVARELEASNAGRKDSSRQLAENAIKEAKDLKHKADRIKKCVSELEFISLYFQAALKFLHGASLLEPCDYDNRSVDLYGETAKLCEFVAKEYERCKDMAAAALAYKCTEVAYMRIIYSKNASMNKDRLELQASLPMAPPGESPTSSASDVDNLNNQVTMDKVAPAKAVDTSQVVGKHIILARNRPSFARLLDYAQEIYLAMEASSNCQNAFASASIGRQEGRAADGISCVRKVVDLSFHDVDELLHLVRLAMEAINR